MLFPWWIKYPNSNNEILNLDWLEYTVKHLSEEVKNFINLNKIKYADPILWDITSQYEANTIVVDPQTGDAYISTKPVPYGVNLNNTNYWTKIYNYADAVNTLEEQIAPANEKLSTTATANRSVGQLVWLNGKLVVVTNAMTAGNAYVIGSNCEYINIEALIGNLALLTTTDKTDIVSAINEVLNDVAVNYTLFSGEIGILDSLDTTNKTNLVAAINEVLSNVGDILTLSTSDKSSIVAAINELANQINFHWQYISSTLKALNSKGIILNNMEIVRVSTTGVAPFKLLTEAITYAENHDNCILLLEPGTYDITILYPTATTVGCIVPDNCYLVGNGYREEVILSGILGAADTQWSPVNMTKNCGLFNLTVQAKNARYCVHDDMSEEGEYTRVIDNCVFKGESLTLRWAYGAGTRAGNKTLLSNCQFINDNGNFSIHNRVGAEYPNLIELTDCSFIQYAYGDNPYDIMLACMNEDSGVTTHGDVNVNIHNCNANCIYSVASAGYVSFFNINCDNPDTPLFSAYDPQRVNCAGTIKCVNSQSITKGTLVTFTSFNKACQKFEPTYTKAFANGVTISDTSIDGLNEVLVRTDGYVTGNDIGIAVQPSKFLNYDSGTDSLVVENTEGAIPVAYGLASGVWKLVL